MKNSNEIEHSDGPTTGNFERILELEAMLRFVIPVDLKEYLIKHQSVIFKRKKFMRIVNKNFSQEMTLEKILSAEEMLLGMQNLSDDENIKGNNLLYFGETPGSPVICIGLNNTNYDKVYVLDWDFGLTKISDSFNDFIDSLY